jgi:hypothetical protein
MTCIRPALRKAWSTLATAGVLVGVLYATTPVAFAEDQYPPGWNTKTDVPWSKIYRTIPTWTDSKVYWADQKWPGDIPSRYWPEQCHWDWCRIATHQRATTTAKNIGGEQAE